MNLGWQKNVTWVSRLQCTQAAVESQLQVLAKEHPKDKVALVSFNNDVTVIGDGLQPSAVVAGDKLVNEKELKLVGSEFKVSAAVKEAEGSLSKKLWELEENGQTALGPGLMVSIAMAGQKPGSKVILCTDGLANIGCGRLDSVETEEELEVAQQFYSSAAKFAKELGVAISVVTIEGTHCSMELIGMLAHETGGQVFSFSPFVWIDWVFTF